ncbi:MAG: Nudix family hydrolase [Methyloprofundus sp.]|nr:Nudix family hydrolase [Methyloprofundus sp.]
MPEVDVAVGVVRDKAGRVLIAKRKAGVHQGGLWEFPGGKVEQAEEVEKALNRELYEELNISVKWSSPLIKVNFNYPECTVHLHVREVHDFDGDPIGREGQMCRWVTEQELDEYEFPEANKAILSAIKLGRHYAIIGGNSSRQILADLESVSAQGVGLVQIRVKGLSELATEEILLALMRKCKELGLMFLLNSQMPVKKRLDEGLHLTSFGLMDLTQRPENSGFVAASCHSLQELRKAEQLALDFAVLSPVKETTSHPETKALGWQQFAEWAAKVNIPVFALGGVVKQDYETALRCGAQGISGISLYKGDKL